MNKRNLGLGKRRYREIAKALSIVNLPEFYVNVQIYGTDLRIWLSAVENQDLTIDLDCGYFEKESTIQFLDNPNTFLEEMFDATLDQILGWHSILAHGECGAHYLGAQCKTKLSESDLPFIWNYENNRLNFCEHHKKEYGTKYIDWDNLTVS